MWEILHTVKERMYLCMVCFQWPISWTAEMRHIAKCYDKLWKASFISKVLFNQSNLNHHLNGSQPTKFSVSYQSKDKLFSCGFYFKSVAGKLCTWSSHGMQGSTGCHSADHGSMFSCFWDGGYFCALSQKQPLGLLLQLYSLPCPPAILIVAISPFSWCSSVPCSCWLWL